VLMAASSYNGAPTACTLQQDKFPSALGRMAECKAMLRGKRLAIFLDYDGEDGARLQREGNMRACARAHTAHARAHTHTHTHTHTAHTHTQRTHTHSARAHTAHAHTHTHTHTQHTRTHTHTHAHTHTHTHQAAYYNYSCMRACTHMHAVHSHARNAHICAGTLTPIVANPDEAFLSAQVRCYCRVYQRAGARCEG